jgi:hypothetical protein
MEKAIQQSFEIPAFKKAIHERTQTAFEVD